MENQNRRSLLARLGDITCWQMLVASFAINIFLTAIILSGDPPPPEDALEAKSAQLQQARDRAASPHTYSTLYLSQPSHRAELDAILASCGTMSTMTSRQAQQCLAAEDALEQITTTTKE